VWLQMQLHGGTRDSLPAAWGGGLQRWVTTVGYNGGLQGGTKVVAACLGSICSAARRPRASSAQPVCAPG
jgi:hypothetical protein